MVICINGHCFKVVVIPWWRPKPGPGPINYPQMIYDATLVASVQAAGEQANDEGVRVALQKGVEAAMKAMRNRAGEGIEIEASHEG
jgi:hypothetical protein